MPQMLASGDVAAVGCWQPIVNQALKAVPGSHMLYTSADEPGLIYDVLAANPTSAKTRRADWLKMAKVWDKVVAYIEDPKTQPDAVKIMAARSGVTPEEYLPLLKGTKLLSLAEGKKIYVKGTGFKSLYGSTKIVDTFNVANGVYKTPENIDSYLDPSFTSGK
jgi:NitT/TauT family transport system substrate-binding protein